MRKNTQLWFVCLGLLLAVITSLRAQDTVTIPKSRLEELQRAEEEVKKLKAQPPPTNQPNQPTATIQEQPVTSSPKPKPAPKPVRISPAMPSLAPLKEEEVVEAVDLANHYRADVAAADR